MPKFALLLYGDGREPVLPDTPEWTDGIKRHEEFGQVIADAGATITGGAALDDVATATTVRGRKRLVTDGPFAETREVLGGFYVIDAADLDVALELAKACPEAVVEVRQVLDL